MKLFSSFAMVAAASVIATAALPETANRAFGDERPVKEVYDDDIVADQNRTFDKDTIYVLMEKVFVEGGARLTIEPGTVVKGDNGLNESSTALIICMGAHIIANGTKENPIILTTVLDNLDATDPSVDTDVRNGWGGLVILGKAPTNNGAEGFFVEGILAGDPRTQGGIGGTLEDSSGVLRYVSIRHAGIEIAANNELNSLSLVGVGSKTVLEYVEVFACGDDGIEIWGGAVSAKYVVVSHHDDDAYDFDLGYRGKMQFVFALSDSLSTSKSNWLGEWDGDDVSGATPFAMWKIANATLIGGGDKANSSQAGIVFKANAGAHVYNSIMTNTKKDRAIVIEDNETEGVQDSRKRFEDGEIVFKGNIFSDIGGAASLDSCARWNLKSAKTYIAAPELVDSLEKWNNSYADPKISSIGYMAGEEMLDPRVFADGPAYEDVEEIGDDFFTKVSYKGAFGETNWAMGWTALDQYGYFGSLNNDKVVGVQYLATNRAAAVGSVLSASTVNGKLSINYTANASSGVRVTLRNLMGQAVKTISGQAKAGVNTFAMDIAHVASGSYVIEASAAGKNSTTALTISH